MIAVPALVYATGAYGFFAIPYTILVYPFVFAVMPILWQAAKKNKSRHRRRHRLWPLWLSPARACRGVDGSHRDDALHRAATDRHRDGFSRARHQGRTSPCRGIPDLGAQYLFVRSAGTRAHRNRQGYIDL